VARVKISRCSLQISIRISNPATSRMAFPILFTTTVLLIATTLVILRRLFHAHGTRQRTTLLSSHQQLVSSNSLKQTNTNPPLIVGFLHPYCNAGGGGERVLFAAISYLQRHDPHVLSIVYTGDVSSTDNNFPVTKHEILKRCKERFGIELDETKIEFVHLKWRWLVEDSTWKRFTLAGQGLGAALLAVEALWRLVPDVFFGEGYIWVHR
jgi:alpha-1,2-mannosyltransferase